MNLIDMIQNTAGWFLHSGEFGSLISIVSFIFVIGFAVLIHEGGHFLVARLVGIQVHVFSIGFGRPLYSFERGGTRYQIAMIPVGGYVKMAGEEPGEERTGAPDEFASKSPLQRMAVVAAGPAANIISAVLIMIAVYWVGVPSLYNEPVVGFVTEEAQEEIAVGDQILAVNQIPVAFWEDVAEVVDAYPEEAEAISMTVEREGERREINLPFAHTEEGERYLPFVPATPPVIGSVNWNSPAQQAGLKKGDRILSVNGSEVIQWSDLTSVIHDSMGQPVELVVSRGNETLTLTVTPEEGLIPVNLKGDQKKVGLIGITPKRYARSYGFFDGIKHGAERTWELGRFILEILWKLIGGEISVRSLAGPIGIAQQTGATARQGIMELVIFLSFLSVNLGILNLLPIPILDGGWILIFLGYELVRGRPMPEKLQLRMTQVGLFLLLFLLVYATSNDILRLLGISTIAE